MDTKLLKRIIAFVLCLVLTAGSLPVTARAEEMPEEPTAEETVTAETGAAEGSETIEEQPTRIAAAWSNPYYGIEIEVPDIPEGLGGSLFAELEYHVDPASAAAEIKDDLIERSTEILFGYEIPLDQYTEDGLMELGHAILEEAFLHTGVSNEGDYLRWSFGGWGIATEDPYYSDDGERIVCMMILLPKYLADADQEAAVTSGVDELLAILNPTGTDYEKLKTVYDWMCGEITYDYTSTDLLKHSAYAALVNRTAVCQGYALLLYRLALEMDIDCRIITGNGNGGAHAWNIAKMGSLYYDLDATWDAIWKKAGLDYEFFLRSDANFDDHTRDAEYATASFYASYPMGTGDYTPEPAGPAIIASGTCGENVTWTLDEEGTLTISGEGAMADYAYRDNDAPWYGIREQIVAVVIAEGITNVGDYAFRECSNLVKAELPESVTTIGSTVFWKCANLAEVNIPAGVTEIGTYAFSGCSLKSVKIPAGVKEINDYTFSNCSSLVSVEIPASVTDIYGYAFEKCSNLWHVAYEGTQVQWNEINFSYGNTLLQDARLHPEWTGDDTLDIENKECSGCKPRIKIKMTDLGANGWSGNKIWVYVNNVVAHQVTLSSGKEGSWTVEYDPAKSYRFVWKKASDNYSHQQCGATILLDNEVLFREDYTYFTNCFDGTELCMICSHAWQEATCEAPRTCSNCGMTEGAALGHSWTDATCENPKTCGTCGATEGEALGHSWTDATCENPKTCSTCGATEGEAPGHDWIAATCVSVKTCAVCGGTEGGFDLGAHQFRNGICEYCGDYGGTCGEHVAWTLEDGILTIGGSGAMSDYASTSEVPWYGQRAEITSVVICDGVTAIADRAFYNCTAMTDVSIGKDVTNIGTYAFRGCTALVEVTIPAGVTNLENSAFRACAALATITFGGNAPTIGNNVFNGSSAGSLACEQTV